VEALVDVNNMYCSVKRVTVHKEGLLVPSR